MFIFMNLFICLEFDSLYIENKITRIFFLRINCTNYVLIKKIDLMFNNEKKLKLYHLEFNIKENI